MEWNLIRVEGDRLLEGQASCASCAVMYPVRDGIALFLTPDLPREDLWQSSGNQLMDYLAENPEIKSRLMDTPVDRLNPADQTFRSAVLEEWGIFDQARELEKKALNGMYSAAYRACEREQFEYVIDCIADLEWPLVDLASGHGYLVEEIVRRTGRSVILTDFSPSVLRRNKRYYEFFGLQDSISLLAFDARRTPFKDNAVATLTTNQGLPNIQEPGRLLKELRRIVSGRFLAISHFYPNDDEENIQALRKYGVDALTLRRSAVALFAREGWNVKVANTCNGRAFPTPAGEILEGAKVDAIPVAETILEWCVIEAT